MGISVDITGIQESLDQLNPKRYQQAITRGLEIGGDAIVKEVRKYPKQKAGRPQPFVSDNQRRGFFAKLRSGEIEVPYRRTLATFKGWTVKVRRLSLTISNQVPQIQFTMKKGRQTRFHAEGGWPIAEDKIERLAATRLIRFIDQQIRRITG